MKYHFSARLLRQPKGFTLLELVVVFSIIATISTIGVASFVSYSQTQTLQQAENDLLTALNTAKSLSGAQVKVYPENNLACNVGQSFGGYGIKIVEVTPPGSNYYYFYIMCSGTESPHTTFQTTLPKSVYFDSTNTTTTDVFFPVLTGGVVGSGNIVIYSTFTTPNPTKTIAVDSGGNISQ